MSYPQLVSAPAEARLTMPGAPGMQCAWDRTAQMATSDLECPAQLPTLTIFICTCAATAKRRQAIRRSWMRWKHDEFSPLTAAQRDSVDIVFIGSKEEEGALAQEAAREGDILLLDTPEGYHHLWRKALTFLQYLVHSRETCQHNSGNPTQIGGTQWTPRIQRPDFVMHADDDSYIRLDLLLQRMVSWPRHRWYWGYIWDGTGARCTAPIRDPRNKSHMPVEQYDLDYYPPFASGCGFVLSWDLVLALAKAAPTLPNYRLLDPPFGIHLCGPLDRCILQEPVVPVHDECVRPYRPLPTFRANTVVQHYLKPEEFVPFHKQALQSVQSQTAANSEPQTPDVTTDDLAGGSVAAEQLYKELVSMGLLRR